MRNKVRKAFTLVEILIVVVILGILAAIVIPQFTNATEDAQGGNIKAQLQSLQNQIELFRARHNGSHPFGGTNGIGADDWDLLRGVDANNVPIPGFEEQYIKKDPSNPAVPDATARALVLTDTSTGDAAAGWVYDEDTHTLFASYFDETTGKVTPGTP
jgi:general secretion pathway protein G